MRKNYLHVLYRFAAMICLALCVVVINSCGDDDEPDPVKPETEAKFSAVMPTAYKITEPTGIEVTFTNESKNAKEYSWDFGDGSPAVTEQSPKHVYSIPGTYNVELTVTAADGAAPATHQFSMDVTVTDPTDGLPNILQGGQMEAADEAKWTVLYSGQKTVVDGVKTFNHVKYTFGSTTNLPEGGQGGGFHVENSLTGQEVGSVFYQEINLPAGTYKFSGLMKHGAEDRNGAAGVALKEYWYELYVGKVQPTFDETEAEGNNNGYNDNDPTPDGEPAALTGFFYNAWTGRGEYDDYPATNGVIPQKLWFVTKKPNATAAEKIIQPRKARSRADMNGVFTVTSENAGTYYFVIKMGKGGNGGFGANGITVDNLRLVKIN